MVKTIALALIITCMAGAAPGAEAPPPRFKLEKSLEIAEVPSGFPVGFRLLTAGGRQYAAYYDKHRRMTVAARRLSSDEWTYQILPSKVGWDSHNYVTMAVDANGHLHVSGNMHGVPLVYFRTTTPGDITSLERLAMTGKLEDRVTYPEFIRNRDGKLFFSYRNGASGNGARIYNQYHAATRSWSRLLDTPLMDGEGKRNAYPLGPVLGPDNRFHLVWVWRDSPDCATNHHLSYARSKDLIHWESASGHKVATPIKLDEKSLWVDPVPSGGGIINGCEKLFFGTDRQPVISYHKADPEGNMQIFAARPGKAAWTTHQLTRWNKPVEFGGNGSMGFIGIKISGLERVEPGVLTMSYRHREYGSGRLAVDEKTLRPLTRKIRNRPTHPKELGRLQSDFKGMEIRRQNDSGDSGDGSVRYLLQWETLEANRDRPRTPPLPEPSMLTLHKLVADDAAGKGK